MGDSLSAIADDEDHYYWLCHRYDEEVQVKWTNDGRTYADTYGRHSEELDALWKEQQRDDLTVKQAKRRLHKRRAQSVQASKAFKPQ